MYSVIKEYNPETKLAENEGRLYILKRIGLDEVPLIKKLESINCANVVRFYGTFAAENEFYAVEEFINGVTLYEYVEKNGALNEETAVNVALAVCNGLKEVHNLGIVHRDINPGNVMIDGYGTVKIIDFGISRTQKGASGSDTHILGTRGYAAPEQYGFTQTSSRADIYSLGVLINYITTLSMPNERLADGRLGEIVKKCTQIDENNRYSTVDEVIAALRGKSSVAKSVVPGFRKNVLWHKIVAVIYYAFFFVAMIAYIPPTKGQPLSYNIYWLSFVVFVIGAPVPIATDFLNWSKHVKAFKSFSETQKRLAPIVTGAVYSIAAVLIFIIIDM
ncbi:MAG: serine/threonine protein kinase [Eubacterium sp.]|nr:serine/threonine protein kinase [Eubacterium sp.]